MQKQKQSKNILRKYVESIVQIIEDKPLFDLSLALYKAIIFLSYFQVGIYLLQETNSRILIDLKIQSLAKIARTLSLNQILILQDSGLISTVCIFFSQIFLYFYFVYVGIYSLTKHYFMQQYEYLKPYFQRINQILNMYFCFFISVFLNYQIEISTSIMYCSPKSLFTKDRVDDTSSNYACNIQDWQLALGIGGLLMCGITSGICIYFFRNFEFQDQNLMKRKLNSMYVISTVLKIIITIIEHSNTTNDNKLLVKHILLQVFGIISLLDAVFNNPYLNQDLAYFNIKITSIFYCIIVIFNIWIYSDSLRDDELFYVILVIVVFISAFFQQIYNYRYEKRMQADIYQQVELSEKQTLGIFPFDLYISELVKLGQMSQKEELSKYRLQKVLSIHFQTCKQELCYCQNLKSKGLQQHQENQAQMNSQIKKDEKQPSLLINDGRDIDLNAVYKIADSIYSYLLNQRVIYDNQVEYEYLSLQYITFIIKCLKNQTRANYLLKVLIQRKVQRGSNFSLYFQMISSILTENMEKVIGMLNNHFISSKRKEELTIKHITSADEFCFEYIPIFQDIIKQKQEMWTKMQKGFSNMNEFQNQALKLMSNIKKVKVEFTRRLRLLNKERDFNYCLVIKKLRLLFFLFVLNDSITAYQLEEEVIELRKRDAFLEEDCLNNENLVKKNIITITISISQNIGKITSIKDTKTAEFFGYTSQEFQKITKINELIPPFIEKIHDNIIRTFVQRGQSRYIKSSLLTFCRTNRGYIMPVKLHSDFSFISLDDFYVSGTLLKVNKGSQYLLFDRQGRILGLSEKFAEKLLVHSELMNSLPMAESVIRMLNAFLLIPKIVIRLLRKKKDILQNYQQQRSEIIHTDDNGCIYFNNNMLNELKDFSTYLEKKSYSSSYQNVNKSQRKDNAAQINKNAQIDLLDVLQKESYKKCKHFKRMTHNNLLGQKSTKSNFQNQSEYTAGMKGTVYSTTQQTGQTFFSAKNQYKTTTSFVLKEQYKLQFKYILSYHTIPLVHSQQGKLQINENGESSEERQMYFSLQMDDIQLKENHKQISNLSNTTFFERIANYMKSISCVPAVESLFKPILHKGEMNADDQYIDNKGYKKQLSQRQQHPIPKSFMKYLDSEIQGFLDKKEKDLAKSLVGSKHTKKQLQKEKSEVQNNEISVNSSTESSASSDEDSETDQLDYSFGEDIYNYKINESKNLTLQKKVTERFADCQSQLDDLLDNNDITVADMLSVDSYYKAKRVILHSTQSSQFITTLELAITEALIEMKKEKQLVNNLIMENESEESLIESGKNNKIEMSKEVNNDMDNQITFRNDQSSHFSLQKQSTLNKKNLFMKQTSDVSGFRAHKNIKSSSNSLLDIPRGNKNKFMQRKEQQQQENMDSSHINLIDQNSFNNASHRFIVTQDNLTVQDIYQQSQNQFNVSARPLFEKPKDINNNESEILVTPSSIDDQNSPKKQISFIREDSTAISNNPPVMRKSVSKKYSFIQNSTLLINKSEFKNEIKKSVVLNTNFSQIDPAYNNSSSFVDQKKSTQIENNQFNISNSSRDDIKKVNKSQGTHEKVFNNLLNQGGIFDGIGEKISIHSSSKSSSSYGGYFLKEIIQKEKIPSGARTYSIMLGIFTMLFIALNFTNLMIIKSDMQFFADNVVVLRFPRRLLRDYAKTMYGKYLQYQIEYGFFKDTSQNTYLNLGLNYSSKGVTSYNTLMEQQSSVLIDYALQKQATSENKTYSFSTYTEFIQSQNKLDNSLIFENPLFYLIGVQAKQTKSRQTNSYITLRANFFEFSNSIISFVEFLVNNILTTVDNLILKFTFICVAAIISVIIIPLLAIPVAKNINLYEEKIFMIVSRINYNHSSVERQKMQICQQLLSLDDYEWLKYSYHEVFGLRYNQFNISVVNSNHDLQQISSTKRLDTNRGMKTQNFSSRLYNQKLPTTVSKLQSTNDQSSKMQQQHKQGFKPSQNAKRIVKNTLKGNQERMNIFQSIQIKEQNQYDSSVKSNNNNNRQGKDFVLQSKILDQKLSVPQRMISLLVFMFAAITYFLIVIIYLNINTSFLKTPVQINRQTNLIHVYSTIYLISSELLAYDTKIKKQWSLYDLNDLNFFFSTMKESISQIQTYQSSLTDTIYGNNPYTSEITQQMKNIMEGYICPYMVTNNCTGSKDQLTSYGIKTAVVNFAKIQSSFPDILVPDDASDEDLNIYLNAEDRIKIFVQAFKTQDEVFDIFSSTANASIGTVSLSIQQFLEGFLTYCGIVLAIIIIIVFLYSLSKLYQNIQLTNLFLTFIPEEKLLEEVTLHMLKTLRKM